jgi:hypothetical protein
MPKDQEQVMIIENPLIIVFKEGDKNIFRIDNREDDGHQGYGLLICDLVRHVAKAFKVDEDDVWRWVDGERYHPTTEITQHN